MLPNPDQHPGDRLRLLRERLGYTQKQLADELRVTRAAVAAWENGHRNLEGPALVALQERYNVSIEWLKRGQGEVFRERIPLMGGLASLAFPVLPDLSAWDADGRPSWMGRVETTWPLPEPVALRLLQEAGVGTLSDLVFLRAEGGLSPAVPAGALCLLSTALPDRCDPTMNTPYLLRSAEASDCGRLVEVRTHPSGGRLFTPWGGAPGLVSRWTEAEGPLQRLLLGRLLSFTIWMLAPHH